jgi:hypothetical protein
LLALAGCTGQYKLIVEDQGSQTDGGAGQTGGDGDGDGDGDPGDGDGDPGDGDGDPGDGDGDGDNPPEPCQRGGLCRPLPVSNIDKLDLLFMVDTSASMEQEQAALRQELPRLVNMLSTGDLNGDAVQDFPPATDIHFGVVSSDLGLPGIDIIENCNGLGDEGRLQNVANPELAASGVCSATTYNPPFLWFNKQNDDDPARVANDIACISALGLDGCGFEQQLESVLKAVWPGANQDVTFVTDVAGFGMFGNAGPGFPNGDFIRNGPGDPSLVAIVMVTDEEDCSSRQMDHFVPEASPNGLNTRCYFEGLRGAESNLFQVQRYIELFKMLRPGREDLVLFNAIVGVPTRLVNSEALADVSFDSAANREAFYEGLLAAPEMQEIVDDRGTPEVFEDDGLVPSCDRGDFAKAYPPRRIVEVAKGMGSGGFVQSICQDDFASPITEIVKRIGTRLGTECLPAPLQRTNGRVACDVYWTLPAAQIANGPTSCDDRPFLTSAGTAASGRALCRVNQVPVIETASGLMPGTTMGFYYDDFSPETAAECRAVSSLARIAFTPDAQPPTGVDVVLDCD